VNGKTLVAICSGSNVDFTRLRYISERADSEENMFSVIVPPQSSNFVRLLESLPFRQVGELSYRESLEFSDAPNVFLTIRGPSSNELAGKLEFDSGSPVMDMKDNELAKWHWRHMAGRLNTTSTQVLFRFELFDSGKVLQRLLLSIATDWNVSLVHYRNYGADASRVLMGLDVPSHTRERFHALLADLTKQGIYISDETLNPLNRSFL